MRADDRADAGGFSELERACLRRFLSRNGLVAREVVDASIDAALSDDDVDRAVGRACVRELERVRRAAWRPARRASAALAQHLVSIHWSDPDRDVGRAFDYVAVSLPRYDCTVVVAAAEPRWDFAMARAAFDELALGAFGPATEFLDGVRAALVREWMRFDGFVPRLCEFGLVDGPLARQWLQQVVRRC